MTVMIRIQLLIFIFLLSSILPANAENFPRPVELEQDVNFWVRVYTEINTRSGFIHDSRNLAVVYEAIQVKGGRRSNRRKIKKVKAHYANILNKLASGKRSGLNSKEQRVLDLWGENVSNKRLRQAARDIRFQLGQSNRFREGLIRSGEWRPYIDQTLKDLQMPLELGALPHVESSFNPQAYSRVGAAGIWQFIRSTGKRYMQIDYVVDERMDPFASTVAAAKLLRHNFSVTDSWPLALTAYNHGVASMRRAINKLGTRDITTIVRKYKGRAFGFASRNFYVAFLAALEIDRNPQKYFGPFNQTKPYNYEIVTLQDYLLAKSVAASLEMDISTLRRHNRSLLEPVWTGSKRIPKGFKLRVPTNSSSKPVHELLAAIPINQRFAKQTPDAFHKVVRGDTISEIASRYGYSIRELKAINGINHKNIIRVGQVLRLPIKGNVVVAQADTKVAKPAELVEKEKSKETSEPIIIAQAPKSQEQLIKESAVETRQQEISKSTVPDVNTKTKVGSTAEKNLVVAEVQSEKLTNDTAVEVEPKLESEVALVEVDQQPVNSVAIGESVDEDSIADTDIVVAESESEDLSTNQQAEDLESGDSIVAIETHALEHEEPNVEVETVAEPTLEIAEHATLLTDPSDYTVADDQTIEVQASETLGHYAEWLDLRASQLRKINGMRFGKPVVVGRRIELDFSRVSRGEFEHRRIEYQQNLQEEFFTLYRIDSTRKHIIKRGESLWVLALRKFKVPIWLLRQHNPDVDIDRVRPGTEIVVPILLEVQRENGAELTG